MKTDVKVLRLQENEIVSFSQKFTVTQFHSP